jgi:hypothetical protein
MKSPIYYNDPVSYYLPPWRRIVFVLCIKRLLNIETAVDVNRSSLRTNASYGRLQTTSEMDIER